MGNQSSTIVSGQIFPVENYLAEYNYSQMSKEIKIEKRYLLYMLSSIIIFNVFIVSLQSWKHKISQSCESYL